MIHSEITYAQPIYKLYYVLGAIGMLDKLICNITCLKGTKQIN